MIRNVLAGVAALALMTGAAYAQDSYTSQTTTVSPSDSYSKTTTKTSTDAFGNQTQHTDSVEKSQAMTPDGGSTTVKRTHSTTGAAPMGAPAVTSTTTTRTDE